MSCNIATVGVKLRCLFAVFHLNLFKSVDKTVFHTYLIKIVYKIFVKYVKKRIKAKFKNPPKTGKNTQKKQ